MKKENNKKTLKKLQEELLDIVISKYYDNDNEIKECIDNINYKKSEMEKKLKERNKNKEKNTKENKKFFVKLYEKTLIVCEKLLRKEKISNEIMGNEYLNDELNEAHEDIVDAVFKIDKNEKENKL